ncbi:hypothetical protein OBK04_09270, partial [Empedobacter falsenii]
MQNIISSLIFKHKKTSSIDEVFYIFMMSRPEIAIQKKIIVIMEERSNYVKRTQRDYSMSFKLN